MAFTCGFFNSENGDRKYNAEQMSAIFDGIIADGVCRCWSVLARRGSTIRGM